MATAKRDLGTKRQDDEPQQTSQETLPAHQSDNEQDERPARAAQTRGRLQNWQRGGLTNVSTEQLARGLGWFSIGLGLAELLAPRGIANIVGAGHKHTGLIRLYGLREIASGIAIFAQGRRPAAAVWSRVVGDALDLATLGVAFAAPDSNKGRVAFATANVLTVTALDVFCAQQLSSGKDTTSGAIRVRKSIVVNRPPAEVYQFWHDFQNLARFMRHLESVQTTGARRSHWVVKGPAGTTVEWDAEITEDRPDELIAWRSLKGADVDNAGTVRFERAPGGRGTIVHVDLEYSPPGGVLGAGLAMLLGEEPEQQMNDDLRRFKQVIETGDVVVSDATIHGTGLTEQRPAQPQGRADG
jgi:uncharacterized membrane protein